MWMYGCCTNRHVIQHGPIVMLRHGAVMSHRGVLPGEVVGMSARTVVVRVHSGHRAKFVIRVSVGGRWGRFRRFGEGVVAVIACGGITETLFKYNNSTFGYNGYKVFGFEMMYNNKE